jgi:hypothetical protein
MDRIFLYMRHSLLLCEERLCLKAELDALKYIFVQYCAISVTTSELHAATVQSLSISQKGSSHCLAIEIYLSASLIPVVP